MRGPVLQELGLTNEKYGLITMHRPSNVDEPEVLEDLLELFFDLSQKLPLVFPLHPRTRAASERTGLTRLFVESDGFKVIDPMPYRKNLALMASAKVVFTDSSGIREETSFLRKPCLTIRYNTERPITTEIGTSKLVENDVSKILGSFQDAMEGRWSEGEEIPLWDGRTGERVCDAIIEFIYTKHAE
ncbi:MAG: UDP-N-acetyl glucosamine 2-epimerase [Proteobacteria bacterium]|nr:UDP-N-acetyl glucosamine 2-epimerase [Pseudomonadota bacterium]